MSGLPRLARRGIGGSTRVGAVLGWPVEHSRSPHLHNAAFAALGMDAVFVALPVPPGKAAAAVRGLASCGMLGLSVTVPHKEAVAGACDRLEPLARLSGAVNCVSFEGGAVVGHNTDATGFVDALGEEIGGSMAGARAVLVGAGGAARAVFQGLLAAGAGSVAVVARRPAAVEWTGAAPFAAESLAALFPGADLVVDCTSTGLRPGGMAELPAPLPLDLLPREAVVCSLVYHREPELLTRARERGLRAVDGLGMLVHQGARAFRIWTGREAPVAAMWRALRHERG